MVVGLAARVIAGGVKAAIEASEAERGFHELAAPLQLLEQGDLDGAEAALHGVIAAAGPSPRARSLQGRANVLLAGIHEQQGRLRVAEAAWARAVLLLDQPRDADAERAARERLIAARRQLLETARVKVERGPMADSASAPVAHLPLPGVAASGTPDSGAPPLRYAVRPIAPPGVVTLSGSPQPVRPRRPGAGLFVLALLALGGLVLIGKASAPPKPLAPGEAEFRAASDELTFWRGRLGYGNTPAARELAETFAKEIQRLEPVFFTGGRGKDAFSLSEDHFITYCELTDERVCFLVHVPELKNYRDETRDVLATLTWDVATSVTKDLRARHERELGVGLRGALLYGVTLRGTPGEDPTKKTGYAVDPDPLYEFFKEPGASGTAAAVVSGS